MDSLFWMPYRKGLALRGMTGKEDAIPLLRARGKLLQFLPFSRGGQEGFFLGRDGSGDKNKVIINREKGNDKST